MDNDARRAIELNEASWWSLWGKIWRPDPNSYVLTSEEFDEPFFNRAGLLSCGSASSLIDAIEGVFRGANRRPHLFVFDSCGRTNSHLKGRGYSEVDVMVVQRSSGSGLKPTAGVLVRKAGADDIGPWIDAYLLSFYGDLTLKPKVEGIVGRALRSRNSTFLVGELDGKVVGVTALHRTSGLLGLFCLGTLPRYRNRGVARTLIRSAQEIAAAENRSLVLQSLASEETGPFYSRLGFKRLYTKTLMGRNEARPATNAERGSLSDTEFTRDAAVGPHLFNGVFHGFEKVGAVRRIFGEKTEHVLSELIVDVTEDKGYMHINAVKGSIIVSSDYLKGGDKRYLYLDVIHELVHIRQHQEGKQLWDRRYSYIDRPTELEAYRLAVGEARRLGLADNQLVDYLKVEWISETDFRRFLTTLGVKPRKSDES